MPIYFDERKLKKQNKTKQSKQMLHNLPLQGNTNLFRSSCTIANPLMLALIATVARPLREK